MKIVKAPEGYEGCRFYVDGTKSWQASARPIGATWWTNVGGTCGHAWMTSEELDDRAERQIAAAITLGIVK